MRASSVIPFLCGAATLVAGDILSIDLPQTIKFDGSSFDIELYNSLGQGSSYQVAMTFGFDPTSSLPNDQIGSFLGGLYVLDLPLGWSNQTVALFPDSGTSKGTLKIAILETEGVMGNIAVSIYAANVSFGTATSSAYVQATWLGDFDP